MTHRDPYAHTLPPVLAETSRVLRTTVGLRPFRPDGFVVRAESLGEKTLIHDYGHGGSGVSLCWGTAEMSLDLLGDRAVERAAVIGCGAVGLATARLLQRRGVPVTIYTAAQPPNTTTDVSGAFWAPFGLVDVDRLTPEISALIVHAGRIAFDHGDRAGCRPRRGQEARHRRDARRTREGEDRDHCHPETPPELVDVDADGVVGVARVTAGRTTRLT